MLVLDDLAGAGAACRFSPRRQRITVAPAHEGLPFETAPVRFTEKALVPLLRPGQGAGAA